MCGVKYHFVIFLLSYLICFSKSDFKFKIHFLYVGEADCSIIEYKNKDITNLFIVDFGENVSLYKKTNTIDYLKNLYNKSRKHKKNKRNIKLNLILTHSHFDHYWNLEKIYRSFKINKFYYSNFYDDFKNIKFVDKYLNTIFYDDYVRKIIKQIPKNKIERVFSNDIIFKDCNLEIKVLWPEENYKLKNYDFNDNSMVLLITVADKKILLMADAGIEAEKELIEKYKNTNTFKNIEIIKIGHHGNNSSSSKNFINIFNPKFIINSTGPHILTLGTYNLHENKDIIKMWEKRCKNILNTQKDGNIVIEYKNGTFKRK